MTVSANDRRIQYTATASQTVFPYDFQIDDQAEITVLQTVYATGVTYTLTLTTHYTVSGVSVSGGGNITLVTGAALDDTITIIAATALTRPTDFNQAGDFFSADVNLQLDRIIRILQENETTTNRTLLLRPEDSATSLELPVTADRIGKFLTFDASGNPTVSTGSADSITVSPFMSTVLDDTTAGGVLTTLGVTAFAQTLLDAASAAIARAILGTEILDEDDLASDSATKLASQQSIKAYVDANISGAASETVAGIAEIATQTETNTGTDDVRFITPLKLANATSIIKQGVAVSASGASVDFTGIPSGTKRITVMLKGVSTNGTSAFIVQIGATTFTTSGYLGATDAWSSAVSVLAVTNGFGVSDHAAAQLYHGTITLFNIDGTDWVASAVGACSNTAALSLGGGSLALGGTLDRVRITTVNGTDTFDAGSINIQYQ